MFVLFKSNIDFFSGAKFFLKNIYVAAPGVSCGIWDLVPWPGIEPRAICIGSMES